MTTPPAARPCATLVVLVPAVDHRRWFRQLWTGLPGSSTRRHPAPYPLELAERLVRMFSFLGDTVLNPFLGIGTTSVAAARWGCHRHGIEVEPAYFDCALKRFASRPSPLAGLATIKALPSS